jgi:hypothetical protein
MAGRMRLVAPFAGHVIGEGVSDQTLERVGTGFTPDTISEDQAADGQAATFKFRMVTSQQSLENELNIGAELDARYGLFSGGARFDFAQSSSVNTKSTYVLASATVRNALRMGRDFRPGEDAKRLIQAGDKAGFEAAFGTRFVQALRTGGELYALVRITSSSMTHQTKIAASLHAEYNGLAAAGSFKASFDMARNDAASHTEVDVTFHQIGGQGAQIVFVGADADKIKQQMSAFAAAVHDNAVAFEAELLSYEALAIPFPSDEELENKRRILDDCLRKKQRYWSILSDLRLAMDPMAGEIFADLPPAETLMELQFRFQGLLNELMNHARAVASGQIPPALFNPADEPPPPVLKRKSSTSFGLWWSRRNEPTLLRDEALIIHRVGDRVARDLTVSILDATPDAVERGSRFIDDLLLSQSDLESLEPLPRILDAPLRELSAGITRLEDLAGIEKFPNLEQLGFQKARLSDLAPLASLGGLQSLNIADNDVSDLAPLAGLSSLDTLTMGGNDVTSLAPVQGLAKLKLLALAGGDPEQTLQDGVRPFRFLDNPIQDVAPLRALPRLDNGMLRGDRFDLELRSFADLAVQMSGQAQRTGASNRFQLAPQAGGAPATVVQAVFASHDEPGRRLVLLGFFLPAQKAVAFAFAEPAAGGTLTAAESKAAMEAERGLGFLLQVILGLEPTLVLEARAL